MSGAVLAVAVLAIVAIAAAGVCSVRASRERARRVAVEAELARVGAESAGRERLLRAVVESAPMALLLFADSGRIVFANREAQELFFEGQTLEGEDFLALLQKAPEALRRAVLAERDELVTLEEDGQREVWSLAKRHFELEGRRGKELHTLLLVKHLTPEMNRQEVETWRRIIRVVSHELNNSLAPVSSLMHSARVLAKGTSVEPKLLRIVDTVAERAEHLKGFLEGYAGLARMPKPRPQDVEWAPFVERLATLWPDARIAAPTSGKGWFDPAQIEQVVINLLKNASEAGGDPSAIELAIEALDAGAARVTVRDRGQGLSDEVMRSALLPFYSTKEGGSGLGLAICREIVEAHGGRLRIRNREGGGAEIGFRLPRRDAGDAHRAKLTLTRA